MKYTLNKINGRPVHREIELRRCTADEADLVFALQNEVHSSMPHPEQFVPDTLAGISSYLANDLCIGAWDGERLGAYLIIRFCGRGRDNYAAYMDVPEEQMDEWANFESVIVHPDWRGNSLLRVMFETALSMLPEGITAMGETVSPDNKYSLNNAFALGFEIVCRRDMYGGYDRYILAKRLKQRGE